MEEIRIHKMLCTCVPTGNWLLADVDISEKTSLEPETKTGFKVPNDSEREYQSAKKRREEILGNKN
jgi:hypothetical protein